MKKFGFLHPKKLISILLCFSFFVSIFSFKANASSYSRYDLRDYNAVTSVKDQGAANTCWVFAAIGAIESSLIVGGYASSDIDLSEAHLGWFSINSETQNREEISFGDGITIENPYMFGGNDLYVTWALSNGVGLELEKYAEYNTEYINDSIMREDGRFISEYTVTEVNQIEKNDMDNMKKSIVENGALMASYYDSLQYYNSGKDGYSFYDNQNTTTNHATLIIGWDDDYSRDNFGIAKPTKNGAWLCRNTRGENWGDNGYFWISYEDITLNRITSFKAEPTDEEIHKIYKYDGYGYSKILHLDDSGLVYISNIFEICEDGFLDKISFYSAIKDISHEISIYSLDESYTSPTDGKLLYTFNKSTKHLGYNLCSLPSPIKVKSTETISITLKIQGEGKIKFYSEGTENRTSTLGKSFVSADGENWLDTVESNLGNLCIKAWVNPLNYKLPDINSIYTTVNTFVDEYKEDDKLLLLLDNTKSIIQDGGCERDFFNFYKRLCCINEKYTNCHIIDTEEKFIEFSKMVNSGKNFFDQVIKLTNDLDFSNMEYISPVSFAGTFDGNYHTIRGIILNKETTGFFEQILNQAIVKNITLTDCNFTASYLAGGICGINNGKIINCLVYSDVYSKTQHYGLIAGQNNGNISHCVIKTPSNKGFIVGDNSNGKVENCISDSSSFVSIGSEATDTVYVKKEGSHLFIYGTNIPIDKINKYVLFKNTPLKNSTEYAYTGYKYNSLEYIIIGDVNGDGKLNTSDYFALKLSFLGNVSLTYAFKYAADINQNNTIDTTDYFLLKSHFLQTYNIYGR